MLREKRQTILLIDDDRATNIINKHIVEKYELADKTICFDDAIHAMDYLLNVQNTIKDIPDLIVLDINMPIMNGWEFIEQFQQLSDDVKSKTSIMLHSNTVNPQDHIKAKKLGIPLLHKPMNLRHVMEKALTPTLSYR